MADVNSVVSDSFKQATPLIAGLIWQAVKWMFLAAAIVLLIGMFMGILTHGRRLRKERRRRDESLFGSLLEVSFGLGEVLTHLIINRIKYGSKQHDTQAGWLNDRQILAKLKAMTPSDFEKFIADVFSRLGYRTGVVGGSGDGGVDITMTKDGRRSIVQCKKFITRKVRPHDVRDFFGAMGDRNIDGKGFFITTNIFTYDAERFAEDKPMELIDGAKLVHLVRESGVLGTTSASTNATPAQKLCPKCGSTLVIKMNRNNGSQFWACPRYPDCRHTESI